MLHLHELVVRQRAVGNRSPVEPVGGKWRQAIRYQRDENSVGWTMRLRESMCRQVGKHEGDDRIEEDLTIHRIAFPKTFLAQIGRAHV